MVVPPPLLRMLPLTFSMSSSVSPGHALAHVISRSGDILRAPRECSGMILPFSTPLHGTGTIRPQRAIMVYGNYVGNASRMNLAGNPSGKSRRRRSWGSNTLDALVEEVDENKGLDDAPDERWGNDGKGRSASGGDGNEPKLTGFVQDSLPGDEESTMPHSESSEGEEKKDEEPYPRSSGYPGENNKFGLTLGAGRSGVREIAHPVRRGWQDRLRRSLR